MKRFVVDFGGEEEMPARPESDLPRYLITWTDRNSAKSHADSSCSHGQEAWIGKLKYRYTDKNENPDTRVWWFWGTNDMESAHEWYHVDTVDMVFRSSITGNTGGVAIDEVCDLVHICGEGGANNAFTGSQREIHAYLERTTGISINRMVAAWYMCGEEGRAWAKRVKDRIPIHHQDSIWFVQIIEDKSTWVRDEKLWCGVISYPEALSEARVAYGPISHMKIESVEIIERV
jgi:hypothetical protein